MNFQIVERKPLRNAPKRKKQASKALSITKLMKMADKLFSYNVRQINVPVGTLSCFTCGKRFEKKKLQCGHYLSRYYKAARWDYDNARPQCMMCNMWKRGDPITFRANLIKEIGEERVKAVEAKRNVSFKLTREFLEDLIAKLS